MGKGGSCGPPFLFVDRWLTAAKNGPGAREDAMKLGSVLGLLLLLAALGYVALQVQKQEAAPPAENETAGRQVSGAAQAAADELYQKQNEFRTWSANHPEKPSAGYATVSPSQQR
jgi:hypothetical protein